MLPARGALFQAIGGPGVRLAACRSEALSGGTKPNQRDETAAGKVPDLAEPRQMLFAQMSSDCDRWSPMGITRRPPSISCASSAGGTTPAAAVTMIRSKGASAEHPSVPSPTRSRTFLNAQPPQIARRPLWAKAACAARC